MKLDSSKNEKIYFRGFLGLTKIVYSSIEKGWIIKDYNLKNTGRIFGIFNKITIPIGLQNWSMFTTCETEHKNPKNVQLKFTKVFFLQLNPENLNLRSVPQRNNYSIEHFKFEILQDFTTSIT